MRSKWVYVGVAGVLGVLGIVWWQSQKSATPTGPQNAVDPNAQVGAISPMGTAPDLGNLLSYNQVPGAISAPQLTSVDPFAGNYYSVPWSTPMGYTQAGANP